MKPHYLLSSAVTFALFATTVSAADWPCYLGPNRDLTSTAREVGAAMEAQSPDAVLTLDPDIAMAALKEVTSRGAMLATFDLSPEVLDAVSAGKVAFAVDQQPYLQGYLPVSFLELAVRNRNEVGAGTLVATGPSLVTKENAAAIAALSEQGTR